MGRKKKKEEGKWKGKEEGVKERNDRVGSSDRSKE